MNKRPEPDSFEKRLRFGCGFIFGVVVTCLCTLQTFATVGGALIISGVAIVFGFLVMRYGDDFWRVLSNWLR
jgi:hypothetical protein